MRTSLTFITCISASPYNISAPLATNFLRSRCASCGHCLSVVKKNVHCASAFREASVLVASRTYVPTLPAGCGLVVSERPGHLLRLVSLLAMLSNLFIAPDNTIHCSPQVLLSAWQLGMSYRCPTLLLYNIASLFWLVCCVWFVSLLARCQKCSLHQLSLYMGGGLIAWSMTSIACLLGVICIGPFQ